MAILNELKYYLIANPDARFGQALVNMNVLKLDNQSNNEIPSYADPFYEEPEETLKRIKIRS